mmetsp:Transcript_48225/g.120725  ORF Transcript_48225/g.120725 Transcript_48225/m.120725 type:complete len:82 (-) Transcript_48225:62-307(-)
MRASVQTDRQADRQAGRQTHCDRRDGTSVFVWTVLSVDKATQPQQQTNTHMSHPTAQQPVSHTLTHTLMGTEHARRGVRRS